MNGLYQFIHVPIPLPLKFHVISFHVHDLQSAKNFEVVSSTSEERIFYFKLNIDNFLQNIVENKSIIDVGPCL